MSRFLVVLLSSFLTFSAIADDLYFYVSPGGPTYGDPGLVVTYRAVVRNPTGRPVHDVTMTVPLPPGQLLDVVPEHPDWKCTSSPGEVVCTRAELPVSDSSNDSGVRITVMLSQDPRGMAFLGIAKATARDAAFSQDTHGVPAITNALFAITSTADSGPGTLRAIIEETNAHCTGKIPCKVTVELTRNSTIEPLTPLPAITSCNMFLAGGRAVREGDRRLELSGARLTTGSGLEFHSQCDGRVEIVDIAINRFPDYAILVGEKTYGVDLRGVFLGTDMTDQELRPNTRGIGVFFKGASVLVENSIIRGNRRSGVFQWIGGTTVQSSLIDHNGASGVFAAYGQVWIWSSTIAHNGEFGLAVSPAIDNVSFHAGSMHSNGITGIDWNLDGPSPRPAIQRIPPPPSITDAFFDAAKNVTVVTGTVDRESIVGPLHAVQLYASRALNPSGHAEGERYLIQAGLTAQPDGSFTFRAEIAEDLRGQIVSGTAGSFPWLDGVIAWTTEFSAGMTVR